MAAIVGVIANLFLWFALHGLFTKMTTTSFWLLQFPMPDLATLDWRVVVTWCDLVDGVFAEMGPVSRLGRRCTMWHYLGRCWPWLTDRHSIFHHQAAIGELPFCQSSVANAPQLSDFELQARKTHKDHDA